MNADKESQLPRFCTARSRSPIGDLDQTGAKPGFSSQNLCLSVSICGSPDNEGHDPPSVEDQSRTNRDSRQGSRLCCGLNVALGLLWKALSRLSAFYILPSTFAPGGFAQPSFRFQLSGFSFQLSAFSISAFAKVWPCAASPGACVEPEWSLRVA